MEVIILQDVKEIGGIAADAIGALLRRKPTAVLGLATGSSPLAIYDELVSRCDAGLISFRQARGFTLDEYVGLPADHPQRYRNVIDNVLVSRVDFAPGAVQGPDGLAADIPAACAEYENAIQRRGRSRSADSRDRHRRAHRFQRARVFTRLPNAHQDAHPADPPRQRALLRRRCRLGAHALSDPGVGNDHGCQALILVAIGRRKSEAVHHLVEGPVSALWPATILQHHPHVTALLDDAAAERLQLANYYRETYRSKPDWQGI